MIVCPNCSHQNPDGAEQCEACFTPLPATAICPNCGATVQADASFCGQCGFNLRSAGVPVAAGGAALSVDPSADPSMMTADLPDLLPPDPLVPPDPLPSNPAIALSSPPVSAPIPDIPSTPAPLPDTQQSEALASSAVSPAVASPAPVVGEPTTQLQRHTAHLLHVQTNTLIELPQNLSVIHIGKPNDRIPPDVDVSGFSDSEIVSRIHADIRIEGDAFYIEDVGSSNGTYINNVPLPMGNRHRMRPGDRLSLGKGDKVTFLFQLS